MGENNITALLLFFVPFVIGFLIRLFCRKQKRGYLVTVVLAVLTLVSWVVLFSAFPGVASAMDLVATALLSATIGAVVEGVLLLVLPK